MDATNSQTEYKELENSQTHQSWQTATVCLNKEAQTDTYAQKVSINRTSTAAIIAISSRSDGQRLTKKGACRRTNINEEGKLNRTRTSISLWMFGDYDRRLNKKTPQETET